VNDETANLERYTNSRPFRQGDRQIDRAEKNALRLWFFRFLEKTKRNSSVVRDWPCSGLYVSRKFRATINGAFDRFATQDVAGVVGHDNANGNAGSVT
jgi:hypothetical protein